MKLVMRVTMFLFASVSVVFFAIAVLFFFSEFLTIVSMYVAGILAELFFEAAKELDRKAKSRHNP